LRDNPATMSDRMPWSPRTALAAVLFVRLVALLGFGLVVTGNSLGWLCLFLATWFVIGMVATAYGSGTGGAG
jgi:hypothetical protein